MPRTSKRVKEAKEVSNTVSIKRRTTGLRADAVKTDHGKQFLHQKANRFSRALEKEYKDSVKAEVLRRKVNEIHAILEIKDNNILESML